MAKQGNGIMLKNAKEIAAVMRCRVDEIPSLIKAGAPIFREGDHPRAPYCAHRGMLDEWAYGQAKQKCKTMSIAETYPKLI